MGPLKVGGYVVIDKKIEPGKLLEAVRGCCLKAAGDPAGLKALPLQKTKVREESPRDSQPAITPVKMPATTGGKPPAGPAKFIKSGKGYIIKENEPVISFAILNEFLDSGIPGLCISRATLAESEKKYSLTNTALLSFIQLRFQGSGCLSPTNTDRIFKTISDFIAQRGDCIVLFSGLDDVILYAGSSDVAKLVRGIRKQVESHKSRLVMPLNTDELEKDDLGMLTEEFACLEIPQSAGTKSSNDNKSDTR